MRDLHAGLDYSGITPRVAKSLGEVSYGNRSGRYDNARRSHAAAAILRPEIAISEGVD